jgi:penicillin-binding protein 1A
LQRVGPDAIVSMAQKLGIRTPLQPAPSLALGTGAVTPLDMASVSATLAAGGIVSGPTLPATAWRLFMERALAGMGNAAFPAPLSSAQFTPWRGRYAYRAPSSP